MHTHDVDIDFDEENSEKERVLQKWYREASELLLRSNSTHERLRESEMSGAFCFFSVCLMCMILGI